MRWVPLAMLIFVACDARHVLGRARLEPGCGAFESGSNLSVCSAGFVGASAPAVDVSPDGALVVATQDVLAFASGALHALNPGKAGFVRIAPSTRQVLSRTVLGEAVVDLEVSQAQGFVAALGLPWGVALLSADGGTLLWTARVPGSRVSVGNDGTVAVWDDASAGVAVFDRTGKSLSAFTSHASVGPGDVSVDGANKQVVVVGRTGGLPVMEAFDYQGNARWRNYDWPDGLADAEKLTAASKGLRVQLGRDGGLYLLGESNGGNTVFSRDPRAFTEPAALVSYDEFNTPYNTSKPIVFLGRFTATTGSFLLGQFLLARAEGAAPRKGVATLAGGLAADEQGQVAVALSHGCCAPAPGAVAGQALVASSSDFAVVILSADLRTRALWTTFGKGGVSAPLGVAMGEGVVGVTAVQTAADGERGLVVHQPLLPTTAGGYFAFWPSP